MDQKINNATPFIWSCLSINFRFFGRFSKPTKTSNKGLSHNNSFCWPSGLDSYFVCKRFAAHSNPPVVTGIFDPTKSQERHQHNTVSLKKNFILQTSPHSTSPTPATQLKPSLTLQIFQKSCPSLVSNKTLALHHFYSPKKCIFKALGKQMSIYSCKSP